MATRVFCDRCNNEIKGEPIIVGTGPKEGERIRAKWELCPPCEVELRLWVSAGVPQAAPRKE